MLVCQGDTINKAWENAIYTFVRKCIVSRYEGHEVAFVDDLLIYIENPFPMPIHNLCFWKESWREWYINAIDSGDSAMEINRLYASFGKSMCQYELLLHTLRNMDSDRPVFASLYNPSIDLAPRHSLPCLMSIEFQKKNMTIDMKANFSIWNLYTYGILDMNQIACFYNSVCKELLCKSGSLTVYSSHSIMNAIEFFVCKESVKKYGGD